MTHRLAKTAAVFALAALSTFAHAQEPMQAQAPWQDQNPDQEPGQMLSVSGADGDDGEAPARVGRLSLVEGKVSIGGDVGDASNDAVLNWPIASGNLITTAPGARTELRVGSTAIRLDGDSSLEVTALDDDRLHLRLHYGSASVRVTNPELASGFELRTAQARVLLTQPGRLRVDAELTPDTSVVSVLEGEARFDGAGASLTLRAGRSAEVRDDDVRTLQARRDAFDDWSARRDSVADSPSAARYVGTEMTGYEELDRHGSWSVDAEYGNLWTPTVVAGWVPYRDGRWSWIAPWGWTWVDNAPWGYAPFHYGRWVQVNRRWAWAPGRQVRRPVWSPALVGWVGGKDWNVGFHGAQRPATGWYPLGPRDRYVPGYRLSQERLRRLNDYGWSINRDRKDRRDNDRRDGRPDFRRDGLTVVPHEHFGGRAPVLVSNQPRAVAAVPRVPGMAPPPPAWRDQAPRHQVEIIRPQRDRDSWERDRDRIDRDRFERERFDGDRFNRERAERDRMTRERNDRFERERLERERFERERLERDRPRGVIATAPQTGIVTSPAVQPGWQRPDRGGDGERNRDRWRERQDDGQRGGGERGVNVGGDRGGRNEDRGRPPPARVAPPQSAPVNRPAPSPSGGRGFARPGTSTNAQLQ